MDAETSEYSVYVGNLECTVPVSDMEEILYELFLQVSMKYFALASTLLRELGI